MIARDLWRGLLQEGPGEVVIEAEHCLAGQRLPWIHRDSFDRLPVAWAMQGDLPLVAAECILTGSGGRVIRVPAWVPED